MTPSDLLFLGKQGSVSFAQNVYARRDFSNLFGAFEHSIEYFSLSTA